MENKYLEVTYRKGRLLAAYLYLPREIGEKSIRTEKLNEGVLIDYGKSHRPIGIEITDPKQVNLNIINNTLSKLQVMTVQEEDFAPLAAVS